MQCPNCGGDDIVVEEIKALCLDCEFEGTKLVFSNIPAEIVTDFVDEKLPSKTDYAMMCYGCMHLMGPKACNCKTINTCVSCSEDIPPGAPMCSECHYWYTKEN